MDTVQLYRKLRYQVDFLALDLYPLPVRFPPTIPEEFFQDCFIFLIHPRRRFQSDPCLGRILGRYLRGETLILEPGEATREKGWILVCVDQYALGWGKLVNGVLKNKYWSGWRLKS